MFPGTSLVARIISPETLGPSAHRLAWAGSSSRVACRVNGIRSTQDVCGTAFERAAFILSVDNFSST